VVRQAAVEAETPFASFGRRLAALALDALVATAVWCALVVGGVQLAGALTEGQVEYGWVSTVFFGGLYLFIPIVSSYFWFGNSVGGTPGKRLLGLRMVTEKGRAPGLVREFVRCLIPAALVLAMMLIPLMVDLYPGPWTVVGVIVSYLAFALVCVDHLWMLWDKRGQTLHDKMGGTYVIRRRRRALAT
jgi:uncharacterized RDD family membrane protein YckC